MDMSNAQISIVSPGHMDVFWPLVKPYFEQALDEDPYLNEDIMFADLMEDLSLLFVASVDKDGKQEVIGGVVTNIVTGKFGIVNIICLGGVHVNEWKDAMVETLEKYARSMDCRMILSAGSKGWEKILPTFTPGKIIYYKEVA